jgi:hypothetical protein
MMVLRGRSVHAPSPPVRYAAGSVCYLRKAVVADDGGVGPQLAMTLIFSLAWNSAEFGSFLIEMT